jgi:signal peptidase I
MHTIDIGQANFTALAAAILGEGSTLRFYARGTSMRPFIQDGDILEVQPVGTLAVRRGDVVLCRQGGGRLVAHRVVHLSREDGRTTMVTWGDALTGPDAPISLEQVLGRVVVVERETKRLRLDARPQRLLWALWMGLSPFSRRLYCAWAAFGRRLYRRQSIEMN